MEYRDIEAKLTPAAREALDELTHEHRRSILIGAAQSASRYARDIREISVQDILQGVQGLHGITGQLRRRRSRSDQYLVMNAAVGAMLAMAAVVWTFVEKLPDLRQMDQLLPIAVAVSGLMVSVFSITLLQVRRSRSESSSLGLNGREEPVGDEQMLLLYWQRLELTLRNRVASTTGESTATEPVSKLIRGLESEGSLTPSEVQTLRRLLDVRNRLVHLLGVDPEVVRLATREAAGLLAKLGERPAMNG